MDRVNIVEKPGNATYYMGQAPEEYGYRIFEMAEWGDAVINTVQMMLGTQRSDSWRTVASKEEYDRIIKDTKGRTVYEVSFDLIFRGLNINTMLDFQAKRFRLTVNPGLTMAEKNKLADFVDILHDEDYYIEKEREELDKEIDFSRINIIKKVAWAMLLISGVMIGFDIFSDNTASETTGIVSVINMLAIIGLDVYEWLVKRKRNQVKRQKYISQNEER